MYAKAMTWWTYFRVSLEERMVYRGDFVLGIMMRFLPFATQVFMYWAIYETLQQGTSQDGSLNGDIAGYTFYNLIAYLLLRTAQATQTVINQPLAFVRLVRLNLMHRRPINALKNPPPPPKYDSRQMALTL